jgi:Asp-tRNA(Asn)/Glu-tRNA(Gln) amidotransferase A subunit family amidase
MIVYPDSCDLGSLAAGLRSGHLAGQDYLRRLSAIFESAQPAIHAFLPEPNRFARLMQEAAEQVAHDPDPERRPALFGVPVAVDDRFHVSGFVTRAGSHLDPELLGGPEATSVTALRRAGVLFAGKTTTAEFGYRPPGPACNPHRNRQLLGMASAGAAAAVAAGLVPLALGTQTLGDTNLAAARCGMAGFKPSYGRIRCDGVVPLAPSLDQIGWVAGDVSGALTTARLVMGNADEQGPPAQPPTIGAWVLREEWDLDPIIVEHYGAIAVRLREQDCRVVEVLVPVEIRELEARIIDLIAFEAAQIHSHWFDTQREHYRPEFADLIERGIRVRHETADHLRAERLGLRRLLTDEMDRSGVDIYVAPAFATIDGPASPRDTALHLPAVISGLPALSLPAGFEGDAPLAVQLIGRWYGDSQLLHHAQTIASLLEEPEPQPFRWFQGLF